MYLSEHTLNMKAVIWIQLEAPKVPWEVLGKAMRSTSKQTNVVVYMPDGGYVEVGTETEEELENFVLILRRELSELLSTQ
jgi:hypothetical protein